MSVILESRFGVSVVFGILSWYTAKTTAAVWKSNPHLQNVEPWHIGAVAAVVVYSMRDRRGIGFRSQLASTPAQEVMNAMRSNTVDDILSFDAAVDS